MNQNHEILILFYRDAEVAHSVSQQDCRDQKEKKKEKKKKKRKKERKRKKQRSIKDVPAGPHQQPLVVGLSAHMEASISITKIINDWQENV